LCNAAPIDTASLIRQARLRAGLSQEELAQRSGRDRAQIHRWEKAVNAPSFENLRLLLQACGFDLSTELIPYAPQDDDELRAGLHETPQERLAGLLRRRDETAR
jgi:transcriptional regulator with XRE-family HTH domain